MALIGPVVQIQHLPRGVSEADIIELCGSFGPLAYILNDGVMASVEFERLDSARQMLSTAQETGIFMGTNQLNCSPAPVQNIPRYHRLESIQPTNCLILFVRNVAKNMTPDTFLQICKSTATPLRIALHNKDDEHFALIEFMSVDDARAIKLKLNGQNIFTGCNALKIDFAKLQHVRVTPGDPKGLDTTINSSSAAVCGYGIIPTERPGILSDDMEPQAQQQQQQQPVSRPLAQQPMSEKSGKPAFGGAAEPNVTPIGSFGAPPPGAQFPGPRPSIMGNQKAMGMGMRQPGPNAPQAFARQGPQQLGSMFMMSGGSGDGFSGAGPNMGMMSQMGGQQMGNMGGQQMGIGQMGGGQQMGMGQMGGGQQMGMGQMGIGQMGGGGPTQVEGDPHGPLPTSNTGGPDGTGMHYMDSVITLFGLDPKTNCDHLFNLFSQYGNVDKVFFLIPSKSSSSTNNVAFVQMGDPVARDRAMFFLNRIKLFEGGNIAMRFGRERFLKPIDNPNNLSDGSPSYKDYTRTKLQRFYRDFARNNKLSKPVDSLFVFSLPEDFDIAQFVESKGAPRPTEVKSPHNFKNKDKDSTSVILKFESVKDATDALALCNNEMMEEKVKDGKGRDVTKSMRLRLSFYAPEILLLGNADPGGARFRETFVSKSSDYGGGMSSRGGRGGRGGGPPVRGGRAPFPQQNFQQDSYAQSGALDPSNGMGFEIVGQPDWYYSGMPPMGSTMFRGGMRGRGGGPGPHPSGRSRSFRGSPY